MTDPSPKLHTKQGKQRKGPKSERATSRHQDVRGQPLASRSDMTQPQTTTVVARGVEQMTLQDAGRASLLDLPRRETGLTAAAARRGGNWFTTAMPPYEPPTREAAKHDHVLGSKPSTSPESRGPGLSLRDRRNEGRNLDVLIVTEFMIAYKGPYPFGDRFVENVSRIYNEEVPLKYPRMSRWPEKRYPGTVEKWHMFEEKVFRSIERTGTHALEERNVRLVSPRLKTSEPEADTWKEVIQMMWTHLDEKYNIRIVPECKTSIRLLNDEAYDLPQLKRITSAIVHFEPVMDVLTNHHEYARTPVKRNWRDNPCLGGGKAKLSRAESIAVIENIMPNPKQGDLAPLLELIHPSSSDGVEYCWALHGIDYSGLIEHCKLPACRTAEDAIRWTELTLSFVLGALACRPQDLRKIKATNAGLRAFMSGVRSGEWRAQVSPKVLSI